MTPAASRHPVDIWRSFGSASSERSGNMRKPTSKRTKRDAIDEIQIVESSGNVFEDLGLPDADILSVKSTMAIYIWKVISDRGLTQKQAAELLGIDQPGVSDIVRGNLRGYSTDRLIRFLTKLGQDIDLVVTERPSCASRPGILRVRAATPRPAVAAAPVRPRAAARPRTPARRASPGVRPLTGNRQS
jgi:predicted XRE-type DNA-binding protein